MSARVPRLFLLCQSVCASSRISVCPRLSSRLWTFQSSRLKSASSFILGQSEVLLQDGIEIQELPWVIRRLDPREFPFNSRSTTDGRRYVCGVKDEQFVQQLQECVTIYEVLRLLEVPGEKVTASSAAFALQRLSQLCSATGSDDMDSFVRKAVLHELCETVVQGLPQLANNTVVSLAGHAALASSGYDTGFIQHVNNEVEKRVGDSMFSMFDLCSLIRVLSLGARGDIQVTRNLWIHLGSRYKEIDASNIAHVYCAMRYITPDVHYLWKLMAKQLKKCWWKLNGDDVASIASRVAIAGRQSTAVLTALGRWLNTNVASVNDFQLRLLLAAHNDFGIIPGHASFIFPLERYISARVDAMDRTTIAMCMDFFGRQRWLSTRVLDAVARDFETNADSYELHELVYTLRTYGQLNYVPPNSSAFFAEVERILMSKFVEFDAMSILQMLVSFVYIGRFPINFLGHVFSPHFLAQIKGIRDATVQERAFRYLSQLQAAACLEFFHRSYVHVVENELLNLPFTFLDGRHVRLHRHVSLALNQLVGDDCITTLQRPRHMAHFVDFEVCVDKTNTPVSTTTRKSCSKKIALLLLMPEHYCVNVPQLLGEYAMKLRHMQKLGYEVITVDYTTFMCCCRTPADRLRYLHSLLCSHCTLTNPLSPSAPAYIEQDTADAGSETSPDITS